jgi:hypothetical protein
MIETPETEVDSGADASEAEFQALATVIRVFQPLALGARARVWASAAAFLGFSPTAASARSANTAVGAASAVTDHHQSGRFSDDRTPTPKEFLFEKRPHTDVEKVACLAYYLTHYREMPHFKTLDLSKLNTEAAQLKFSNAAYAVDNASKAGMLVPASKGAKQLSSLGELYVQALPDRAAARAAISHSRPRRKTRRPGKQQENPDRADG